MIDNDTRGSTATACNGPDEWGVCPDRVAVAGKWQPVLPCDGCSLNTTTHQIVARLNHLTEFALLAQTTPLPTVDAGGPYTTVVGGLVQLLANGSAANGGALSFPWDLTGDGIYGALGQQVLFEATASPGVRTVSLQGCDALAVCTTATGQVNVAASELADVRVLAMRASHHGAIGEPAPAHPHLFRHARVRQIVRTTRNLPLAQRQAGWSRLQMAYLTVGDEEARQLMQGVPE